MCITAIPPALTVGFHYRLTIIFSEQGNGSKFLPLITTHMLQMQYIETRFKTLAYSSSFSKHIMSYNVIPSLSRLLFRQCKDVGRYCFHTFLYAVMSVYLGVVCLCITPFSSLTDSGNSQTNSEEKKKAELGWQRVQ